MSDPLAFVTLEALASYVREEVEAPGLGVSLSPPDFVGEFISPYWHAMREKLKFYHPEIDGADILQIRIEIRKQEG